VADFQPHLGGRRSSLSTDRVGGVFDAHYVKVYRYLASRVGVTSAEDLAQDTFLIVVANPRLCLAVQEPEQARPVLFGVATRLVAQYWRRQARQARAMARAVAADGSPDGDVGGESESAARLDAQALGPALAEALGRLPGRDRDVLLLSALADLTPAEVATALGMHPVTTRVRLHRARARLRAQLPPQADPRHPPEDGSPPLGQAWSPASSTHQQIAPTTGGKP